MGSRGTAVEDRHGMAHLGQLAHEVRANEAGAANNKNLHATRLLLPKVTRSGTLAIARRTMSSVAEGRCEVGRLPGWRLRCARNRLAQVAGRAALPRSRDRAARRLAARRTGVLLRPAPAGSLQP